MLRMSQSSSGRNRWMIRNNTKKAFVRQDVQNGYSKRFTTHIVHHATIKIKLNPRSVFTWFTCVANITKQQCTNLLDAIWSVSLALNTKNSWNLNSTSRFFRKLNKFWNLSDFATFHEIFAKKTIRTPGMSLTINYGRVNTNFSNDRPWFSVNQNDSISKKCLKHLKKSHIQRLFRTEKFVQIDEKTLRAPNQHNKLLKINLKVFDLYNHWLHTRYFFQKARSFEIAIKIINRKVKLTKTHLGEHLR